MKKGYKHSPEANERKRIAMLGNQYSLGKNLGNQYGLGYKFSSEGIEKIRIAMLGKQHALGYKHSPEWVERKRIAMLDNQYALGYKHSPEWVERKRITMTQKWQDPVYAKKVFEGLHYRPNKLELEFEKLLNKLLPKEYEYVGDGQFILGGKCPDFMNVNGKKKLIELYGDWWHEGQDPQVRIDHFKQFGFDTLVIWESELKDLDAVKRKIVEFINIKVLLKTPGLYRKYEFLRF